MASSITSNRHTNGDAALAYVNRLKWPVFPLHSINNGRCTCYKSDCEKPGKHPRTMNGFKDATLDLATLKKWWSKWPEANIGVPTGAVSGIVAVDIDPRHQGDNSLKLLIDRFGGLPETIEAITGSGGQHLLFKHPGETIPNKVGGLGGWPCGIDIRGDGGYIVVPPSKHVSGNRYEWELSSRPDIVELADMPPWLLNMLKSPKEGQTQKPEGYWAELLQGVGEGGRNSAVAKLAGYLLRHYIDPLAAFEIVVMWNGRNQPPLQLFEIERTFDSIMKLESEERRERAAWR